MKLTRQGLRDLGSNRRRHKKVEVVVNCSHENMVEESRHMYCPDCEETWDLPGVSTE